MLRSDRIGSAALAACVLALISMLGPVSSRADSGDLENLGARLYRSGTLADGTSLLGRREGGGSVEGTAAACVNCHRRSGLGVREGAILVPPITARYLYRPHTTNVPEADADHGRAHAVSRDAYTPASLARAIREGVAPDGRRLDFLMPRFDLDEANMSALIGYLGTLPTGPAAGVSETAIQIATVVTPDADATQRAAMLSVLERFFATQQAVIGGQSRPLQARREISYRVARRWELHVWELTGSPESWERQLRDRLAAEPVFAVLSGVGGRDWSPVRRFCEGAGLPCLLPNVDLPAHEAGDFYSVYFNDGVALEAAIVAHELRSRATPPRRVVQVYRPGDVGAGAADTLANAIGHDVEITSRALDGAASTAALAEALRGIGDGDALVLWLREQDLRELPGEVVPGADVFVSGIMGGLENAPVPASWRRRARMTYPFEVPDKRAVAMTHPVRWFKTQGIRVTDERVQVQTYLACQIMSETLGHMLDNFVRDFLVERMENMVSWRLISAYYPRLGLGPGQRFASKGGYLVRFVDATGARIEPVGDWVVP